MYIPYRSSLCRTVKIEQIERAQSSNRDLSLEDLQSVLPVTRAGAQRGVEGGSVRPQG